MGIRSEELETSANEVRELSEEMQEMKGRLRENERSLSKFHSSALDQMRKTLLADEEIRRKYETLTEENKVSKQAVEVIVQI